MLIAFFQLFALQASATTLRADSEFGSKYRALRIEGRAAEMKPESWHFAGLGLTAGSAVSKNENKTTGEITENTTREFSGNLAAGYNKEWLLTLSYDWSHTPDTEFKQNMTGIQLTYTHPYGDGQSWGLGFGNYQGKIEHHLSFKILNTTITRDVSLDQKENQITLSFTPIRELSFLLQASSFSYSKSKQDLQTAFANRFLNTYTSDLVNSIGGLPESSAKISATYLLNEDWDFNAIFSQSKLIVDDSSLKRSELTVSRYWEAWVFGGGLGHSTGDGFSETTALLSIGYAWD